MEEGNRWGFRVKTPEHLYNRGRALQLAVARGTLSEEERYKINEHMIQTIMMLEALPLPRPPAEVRSGGATMPAVSERSSRRSPSPAWIAADRPRRTFRRCRGSGSASSIMNRLDSCGSLFL